MTTGYRLKRQDIFLGKELKYGESGENTFVRLAEKDAGRWERPVHETWNVPGEVKQLTTPLIHESAQSVSQFVDKLNYYTTLNAQHLFEQKAQVNGWNIVAYPIGKFFQSYIVKRGFLDGTHGFVHAMFMSFHSFLTRGKLWLLYHK